jgi:hypothetical protein
MIDGPFVGWKPTSEVWNQMKFGLTLYVDKDGVVSSTESYGKSDPLREQTENDDPGALRRTSRMDEPAVYGVVQPGDLPPADFFANRRRLYGSYAVPSSLGFGRPDETNGSIGVDGVSGGANGTHIAGDSSSMLPMELMIYHNLMMDIEGTTRFLGQEFQDSILFGNTSASSPAPSPDQYSDRGPESQPPNMMHGWVLPSVHLFRRVF